MSPSPRLVVRGLSCSLDGRRVLDGVDLDLFPGEVLGVLGANGSGKSTLLRALGGLVPSSGSVWIDGRPLTGLGARQRARLLALMHQKSETSFPFPARDIVMMGRYAHQGRFSGESAADRRAVEAALAFTETQGLGDQPITKMSGGERQRVFLAQALAQDTDLILLDEPTASLDLGYQEHVFDRLSQLARQGRSVLVAVHDLRTAARHCDRLVLLAEGRVLCCGAPEQVLTSEHLQRAYGVSVRVYRNPISGLVDYQVHNPETEARAHIHVVGGGGSAAGLLRTLGNGEFRVTAGVLAPGDSDLQVAAAYGMPVLTCPPFSPIGESAFRDNLEWAARADLTVVSHLCFGDYNLRNLEAALAARELVLIEDSPPEDRDFSAGEGLVLYHRLRDRATVLTEDQFAAWLDGRFPR